MPPTVPPDSWTALVSAEKPDPARHIYITQTSQSIKGKYAISPLVEDCYPPIYDLPTSRATTSNSSSAVFETKNSAIGVTVWVMGKDPIVRERKEPGNSSLKRKPVNIEAKTYMGAIRIVVPQYLNIEPLHIRAKSHNGGVHFFLPPTFSGLLRWTCESGQFKPSKAIMDRYTPVGEQHKHRGVGKIRVADWVIDKEERGDSAELITTNGGINIYEAGENSDASACVIM